MLNCEINNAVENIHELVHNSNYLKCRLLRDINENSLINFLHSQDMMLQNLKFNIRNNCIKKFQLLRDRNLNRSTKLCQFRVNKCFKNVSNVQIPNEITESLALGNKFGIPYNSNKIPVNNIVASIENSIKNMDHHES